MIERIGEKGVSTHTGMDERERGSSWVILYGGSGTGKSRHRLPVAMVDLIPTRIAS